MFKRIKILFVKLLIFLFLLDILVVILNNYKKDGLSFEDYFISKIGICLANLNHKNTFENKNVKVDMPFFDWQMRVKDNNFSTRIFFIGDLAQKSNTVWIGEKNIYFKATFDLLKQFNRDNFKKYLKYFDKEGCIKVHNNIKYQNFDTIKYICKEKQFNELNLFIVDKKIHISYYPYFKETEKSDRFIKFISSIRYKQ